MDKRQLIAALVEKTGVKIDEDDPAFLLVDLNLLVLEKQTSEAAKHLSNLMLEFNAVTTRNVDDFVTVANEALSKFMQRTQELKATLDEMTSARNLSSTVAEAALNTDADKGSQDKSHQMFWWTMPLIFAAGLVIGLITSSLLSH